MREECAVQCFGSASLLASSACIQRSLREEKGREGSFWWYAQSTEYTKQKPAPADGAFTGDANATKVKRDKCKQDIFQNKKILRSFKKQIVQNGMECNFRIIQIISLILHGSAAALPHPFCINKDKTKCKLD